ncbi:uncharacterized protein LOC128208986 [Mya arenaria]|uniref:uncharacterized protein LOC128208986 n=1 Tax=Mya arenaria TaxID=6604 RepID=UPI0022E94FBF|nr:uncharacterized protein LOC128208986 [Mya arenaria]
MSPKVVCVIFVLLFMNVDGQFNLSPRSWYAREAARICAQAGSHYPPGPAGPIFAADKKIIPGPLMVVSVTFGIYVSAGRRAEWGLGRVAFTGKTPGPCHELKILLI